MNKRAIWIIDEGYLVPAIVSVRSFLAVVNMPITILFCGDSGVEKARNVFAEISTDIRFELFQLGDHLPRKEFLPTVRNRIARMVAIEQAEEELLFLLDADILFAPGMEKLVEMIETHPPEKPTVWAVPDQATAWQNHFYFRLFDEKGRKQRLHPQDQQSIYRLIFGEEWKQLLGEHGFNNGMLGIFKGKAAAEKWRYYYVRGLKHPAVNPEDDQVPFSAALKETGTETRILPDYYNSRGAHSGNFAAYHAICGRWRMPFRAVELGEEVYTDFGKIVKQFWHFVPSELRRAFIASLDTLEPHRFRGIPGHFPFWWTYRDIGNYFEKGHFVEVGTREGKSSCFMQELIDLTGKDFTFESIVCSDRFPDGQALAEQSHVSVGMPNQITVLPLSSGEGTARYQNHSLDFVFLNAAESPDQLAEDLAMWLPKVKPGGILAGMDFSIQPGLNIHQESVVFSFCSEKGLICRENYNEFIIELPSHSSEAPGQKVLESIEKERVGI